MSSNFTQLLQSVLAKSLPFALSFVDDALLLAATRLGIQLPWLQGLAATLLIVNLLYWLLRLLKRRDFIKPCPSPDLEVCCGGNSSFRAGLGISPNVSGQAFCRTVDSRDNFPYLLPVLRCSLGKKIPSIKKRWFWIPSYAGMTR